MNRIKQRAGTLVASAYFWFCVIAVVLVIGGILLSVVYWDELSGTDSAGATIRNIGLVIAGLIALPLAIWRGIIADRQAKAAQRSLLNERYQKGAEMLGNDTLSVRLGGIYALQRLAEEYPKEYHIQIMELFCQFARYPVKDENMEGEQGKGMLHPRADVQAVMNAIGNRDEKRIKIEKENSFRLDLSDVKLQGYNMFLANWSRLPSNKEQFNPSSEFLRDPNFSNVHFMRADLSHASLIGANFSGSQFLLADLSSVSFSQANLSGAYFLKANLSGASFNLSHGLFQPAINLTQSQLDVAVADPDNPPKLDELIDPDTGKPLVWRGEAPPKDWSTSVAPP